MICTAEITFIRYRMDQLIQPDHFSILIDSWQVIAHWGQDTGAGSGDRNGN